MGPPEPLAHSSGSNFEGGSYFKLAPAGIAQLKGLKSASLSPILKMIRPYHSDMKLDQGLKGAQVKPRSLLSPR